MSARLEKASRPEPIRLSQRAYDNPPSDLHRAIADELIKIGRLVIVPDYRNIGSSAYITSGSRPEVRALSSVGGA